MASIIFHGPVDSNECRKAVTKLAKRWGGKFSYTSFWNGRRKEWFSNDTIGKAAYCVRLIPVNSYKDCGSRSELAALVREARKIVNTSGIKFSHRI